VSTASVLLQNKLFIKTEKLSVAKLLNNKKNEIAVYLVSKIISPESQIFFETARMQVHSFHGYVVMILVDQEYFYRWSTSLCLQLLM